MSVFFFVFPFINIFFLSVRLFIKLFLQLSFSCRSSILQLLLCFLIPSSLPQSILSSTSFATVFLHGLFLFSCLPVPSLLPSMKTTDYHIWICFVTPCLLSSQILRDRFEFLILTSLNLPRDIKLLINVTSGESSSAREWWRLVFTRPLRNVPTS